MAGEPVLAEQHPELDAFGLTSEKGPTGAFLGLIIGRDQPCGTCGTGDTVTVYRGPQHGLAFDIPVTPAGVAPVDMELAWCIRHGAAGIRLVCQDGSEHTGL